MNKEILTIMWHQGDLPDAYYYCMLKSNNYMPSIEKCRNHIIGEANGNEQEVILAKVPNFNEYQYMTTWNMQKTKRISELEKKIARLKELLKACNIQLYDRDMNYDLISAIDEVLNDTD